MSWETYEARQCIEIWINSRNWKISWLFMSQVLFISRRREKANRTNASLFIQCSLAFYTQVINLKFKWSVEAVNILGTVHLNHYQTSDIWSVAYQPTSAFVQILTCSRIPLTCYITQVYYYAVFVNSPVPVMWFGGS